jgi:hypothetical protein
LPGHVGRRRRLVNENKAVRGDVPVNVANRRWALLLLSR